MSKLARLYYVVLLVSAAFWPQHTANAQFSVTVTAAPVIPAVVGYVPEQRGLFGRRTVYRPVVTALTVASPVSVARRVEVSPQVTLGYSPTTTEVTTYYAPVSPIPTPVTTYYYSPAPPAVPITTYRVPVSAWVPIVGF